MSDLPLFNACVITSLVAQAITLGYIFALLVHAKTHDVQPLIIRFRVATLLNVLMKTMMVATMNTHLTTLQAWLTFVENVFGTFTTLYFDVSTELVPPPRKMFRMFQFIRWASVPYCLLVCGVTYSVSPTNFVR